MGHANLDLLQAFGCMNPESNQSPTHKRPEIKAILLHYATAGSKESTESK
jgi:hypothetical protein